MKFEDFKKELITRYRMHEFDQFLHLLIKATDWSGLLTLLKGEPVRYIKYGLRKGIITEAFLLEIPETDRLAANIYNSVIGLTDFNGTIFLFGDAELTLTQNTTSRCRVSMIGNSTMTAVCNDKSMIELEAHINSFSNITCNDDSFLHATMDGTSELYTNANGNSTIKMLGKYYSTATAIVGQSAFLNAFIRGFHHLDLWTNHENYAVKKREAATMNINSIITQGIFDTTFDNTFE